jgi:predicted chitinase
MGQMEVESAGFERLQENMNYSGRRLLQVFHGRNDITTLEQANEIAQEGPEAIANAMYGGNWGRANLGNNEPGDGWRFHGRGYVQLTGRDNYVRASREFGIDLTTNPDKLAEPETAADVALHYWRDRVVANGHQQDVRAATHDINGGYSHLQERKAAAARWEEMLTPEVMVGLARGEVLLQSVAEQRLAGDAVVIHIQQNLNTLGVPDARGQPLAVDGDRGGANSRTNEAIAAFQRQAGLTGEMSNADLLAATQAALATRQALDVDQALRGMLPENVHTSDRVDGVPDHLVPGPDAPRRTAAAEQPQTAPSPVHSSRQSGPTPTADAPVRLPPMPPVDQLQPGASGAAVLALQEHLRLLNARDAEGRELQPDRDYGPRTQQAVENFQLWTGLEPTGAADRATLDALKTHSAYALEQRARGIPQAGHLADNLKPGVLNAQVAAAERPVQGQAAADAPAQTAMAEPALLPYSDPNHPKHALYAELKTKLEGMDYHLPEARLHQIAGKMDMAGMRAGPQNHYAIRDDNNTFYVVSDIPGFRAYQNLSESVPPIEQTMQQVAAHQQAMEREMSRGPDAPDRGAPGRSL